MEIDELKNYLKVDEDDDDDLIKCLQLAAEEYLLNNGIIQCYEKELYKLAIKLLVAYWYDNRTIQKDKSKTKSSFSLEAIIMQLKPDSV